MARTEKRGKRGRTETTVQPGVTGPPRDPEDDIDAADQQGSIKPLRPDKAWLRKNRVKEED
jgi:hypothetical protein